jgi:signal transduction histidine kinase
VRSATRQFLILGLLLASVVFLFIAAETGQRQLAEASGRVEKAARHEHALGNLQEILSRAESGQRAYILLGERKYLATYQAGFESLGATLQQLTHEFEDASPADRAVVAEVERLSRVKFDEMGESIKLYQDSGRNAAIAFIRGDLGQRTMTEITDRIAGVEAQETDAMLAASRSWRTDRWLNLAIRIAIGAATLFLVFLLGRQVLTYIRSKEREAEESAEREAELERVVKRRTEDLSELSTQLQSVAEKERATLSRELHDELGGLLVAARMDVSWLEEKLPSSDADVQAHFKRVHEALQAGVELKRRVVENLRPTLLDNLGLFPALRWQVSDLCGRAGLNCSERYPNAELNISPEAAIAIFRVVQESLTNVVKHAKARNVEVSVDTQGEWLVIRVKDDGVGLPLDRRRTLRSHGLAAMRHRATGFGGEWRIARCAERGTQVDVRLPLKRIAAATPS